MQLQLQQHAPSPSVTVSCLSDAVQAQLVSASNRHLVLHGTAGPTRLQPNSSNSPARGAEFHAASAIGDPSGRDDDASSGSQHGVIASYSAAVAVPGQVRVWHAA